MDAPKPLVSPADGAPFQVGRSVVLALARELSRSLEQISDHAQACLNLPRSEQSGDLAARSLESIRQSSRWARRQLRNLEHFAESARPERELVGMNSVAEAAILQMEPELRESRVVCRLELANELPMFRGDKSQLRHAVVNLIENGIDAMAETALEARILTVATRFGSAGVSIEVLDRGHGVLLAPFETSFVAFKTTRRRGMGLGLTVARQIAHAHGGLVLATPRSEGGMAIVISIPIPNHVAREAPSPVGADPN